MTRFAPTIRRFDTLESTSDLARSLVADPSMPLPFIVRADRQTKGRGQADRSWYSDEGSLTFTLAIDPEAHGLRVDHGPRLALAAAVAVAEAVGRIVPNERHPGIRWPNDVEAGGRKLGGLLPERIEISAGARLLLGVGLNVNTRLEDASAEVQHLATTVKLLRDAGPLTESEREDLFANLIASLGDSLAQLAADSPSLASRWRAWDTLVGRTIRVDLGTSVLSGRALGIDESGGLRFNDGQAVRVLYGGRILRDIIA